MTVESTLAPDKKKIRVIDKATTVDQELWESTNWLTTARWTLRRQFLRYYWSVPPPWRVALRMLSSRERATPTFASIGSLRSGTTLLSDYIMQHPCVVLPLAKETDASFLTWNYLSSQFPTLREMEWTKQRFGKAITGYCTPVIPSLLFNYASSAFVKKLKIIVLLRNPVDRTFAHWRWHQLHAKNLLRDPLWASHPEFPEAMRLELDAAKSGAASGLHPLGCGGFLQHSIYLPF